VSVGVTAAIVSFWCYF